MKQIIPFAHDLLRQSVHSGDVVVDATLGNGHDSLWLSELVGHTGKVMAFDIQEQAIKQSKALFQAKGITNVECILAGHEHAKDELNKRHITVIDGAIFNLGYLPGSNKQITTTGKTTIEAIDQLFQMLKKERYITLVVYPGHEEGNKEKTILFNYLKTFPAKLADISTYQMVNRSDKAPFVIAIYKK
ncbi:class I SAM-dependent methyltransferase [Bacillaceae bacterium W0354]